MQYHVFTKAWHGRLCLAGIPHYIKPYLLKSTLTHATYMGSLNIFLASILNNLYNLVAGIYSSRSHCCQDGGSCWYADRILCWTATASFWFFIQGHLLCLVIFSWKNIWIERVIIVPANIKFKLAQSEKRYIKSSLQMFCFYFICKCGVTRVV